MVMGLEPMIKYLTRFHWKLAFSAIYCSDIKFAGIKLGRQQLFIFLNLVKIGLPVLCYRNLKGKKHGISSLQLHLSTFTQCGSTFKK